MRDVFLRCLDSFEQPPAAAVQHEARYSDHTVVRVEAKSGSNKAGNATSSADGAGMPSVEDTNGTHEPVPGPSGMSRHQSQASSSR